MPIIIFTANVILYGLFSYNVEQIREVDPSIIVQHWWDWGHSSSNSPFMHRNINARKSVSKLNSESTKDSKDESLTNDLFEAKGSPLRGMRIYKSYIFFYP